MVRYADANTPYADESLSPRSEKCGLGVSPSRAPFQDRQTLHSNRRIQSLSCPNSFRDRQIIISALAFDRTIA